MSPVYKNRKGINKAELFLARPEDSNNFLVLSKDAIAFFRVKGSGKLVCRDMSRDVTDDQFLLRNYDKALTSTYGASAKFDRRALIDMLEMMDSEDVVLTINDDCPIQINGAKFCNHLNNDRIRKLEPVTGIIAPILSNDDNDRSEKDCIWEGDE